MESFVKYMSLIVFVLELVGNMQIVSDFGMALTV